MNFFDDNADDVWLWILPQVTDAKLYLNVNIKGSEEDRLGLPWEQGIHYVWNEEKQIYEESEQKNIREIPEDKIKLYTGRTLDLECYAGIAENNLYEKAAECAGKTIEKVPAKPAVEPVNEPEEFTF